MARTHGLRSTYCHVGCRCDACTQANRLFVERRRESRGIRGAIIPDDLVLSRRLSPTLLAVTCWCERHYVAVSDTDVLNGRTASCGHTDCRDPHESTRPTVSVAV